MSNCFYTNAKIKRRKKVKKNDQIKSEKENEKEVKIRKDGKK